MDAVFRNEVIVNKVATRVIVVVALIIATALGAFVRIPLPFTPVPITLQTFFVLLSGLLLGGRLGAVSQASYCLLGVAGIPIFTSAGSGFAFLAGPTGGYVFGFVAASYWLGNAVKQGDTFRSLCTKLCLAESIILLCGMGWLKVLLGIPWKQLLWVGAIPFIPGDCIKIAAAATLFWRFRSRIKEIL
ncbi:MAG: biotin transporter BioY [Candidatus Omnitrophica bacterium]|nr:biotin transporter BioY [Candidatus Omnitrophota bacterium]